MVMVNFEPSEWPTGPCILIQLVWTNKKFDWINDEPKGEQWLPLNFQVTQKKHFDECKVKLLTYMFTHLLQ